MKKIYNTLFAVAALLAFAPAVFAQTPGQWSINGQINETGEGGTVKYLEWPKAAENGIQQPAGTDFAYSKDISAPQSDGTYWIKLESFATGAASTILTSTPSDIILVLDSSTSMNTRDYSTSSGTVTRISALREATKLFIQNIYDNDADVTAVDPSFAGNRIAMVSYDASAHLLTSGWVDVGASGAVTTLSNAVDNMNLNNWTRPDLGMASAITNFLSGTTDASRKRDDANLTVVMFTDGVPCHNSGSGNTFQAVDANAAIYQGHRLKQDFGATLYTVGLISPTSQDGNIRRGRYFLDLLSSNYPDSNIDQNSTSAWNINGDNITINGMTVGDKDPEGNYFQLVDENTNLNDIFDSISKQSGGSSSQLSAASRNVDVVSNSFIIPHGTNETEAQIAAKVRIFVAKFTGYTIDSNDKKVYSFAEEILKGHTPDTPVDDINGYYYYPLDEDGNIPEDAELTKVDANITVTYSSSTQAVTVKGFDYSSNFCGPIYKTNWDPKQHTEQENITDGLDHWQGYKIIIMIPIEMNPDAVGGPDVATNATGSGIFINDQDVTGLVEFKSPTVSLPVNIHLKKTGLGAGESAKFRIDRAQLPDVIPENFDPSTLTSWSYVSTVFVTRPQGSTDSDPDPVVKVRGLPANMDVTEGGTTIHKSFVYRITEENWSWSYDPQTPPQYTTTSNVTNPFTFSNKKKDNIDVKVRHAESKATNVFKPGVVTNNVKYDDSKPRTATQSGGGQ